jgi:hypothetical protein
MRADSVSLQSQKGCVAASQRKPRRKAKRALDARRAARETGSVTTIHRIVISLKPSGVTLEMQPEA